MNNRHFNFPGANLGPYSDGIEAAGLIFLSGRVGLDDDGALVRGGIGPQTKRAIRNAEAVLQSQGLSLADVVKCTVYLAAMDDFAAMNAAYIEAFGDLRPARTALAAAGLPLGAVVEVDMIACARSEKGEAASVGGPESDG